MKSSGANVRLTCTPKCFGVYVMASCTALFQVLLVFTSPRLTWSYALVLSLSQTERREKGEWTSRSWNTESSLSAFFIWFPSSMHTEHIIPLYIFIFKVGVFALCSLSSSDFYTVWGNKKHAAYACTKNVI